MARQPQCKEQKQALQLIGKLQKQFSNVSDNAVHRKAKHIIADASHLVHSQFELLQSGR